VGEGQPEDKASLRGFGVGPLATTNTHRSQEQWVYRELTTLPVPGCINLKPNSPDMCWVDSDSEMVGNWRGLGTGLFRLVNK
jgi:hypothetical protein